MNNDKLVSARILVIDDDINMMDVLSVVLRRYGHFVKTYTEPLSAIEELRKNNYDILIVNYLMTPVNGDKIVETVREFNKEIYIILMSIHKDLAPSIEVMQKLDIQAYYEKSNRFDNLIMLIQGGIKYIEQINKIKNMNSKLEHYLVDFAKILLQTVGAKDHYTEEHSRRVTMFADIFSKYLKLSSRQISDLQIAAAFHDIGKIGIPDNILLKTTRLTDDEYQVIKTHPTIAANIFSVSDIYKDIYPIMYYHHERYDGKGYPYGLADKDIPLLARIVSVADAFDAMTSKRSYRNELSLDFVKEEIKSKIGTQFDPIVAITFLDILNNEHRLISEIHKSHYFFE